MKFKRPLVGCYYFPNYHTTDERNAWTHGPGWNEWELVKAARPRFPGHKQPRRPVWGYTDEADPAVMEQKIAAAADHGIDYFIFDYYYYDDGPFLEHCLNDGFLRAENVDRLKFCLMWANHDWLDIHPCPRRSRPLLIPGKVTPDTFRKNCRRVIDRYFRHPSYLTLDGAPYFSIYHLEELLKSFGSVAATREALDEFRTLAVNAGFPGVHLNLVVWGNPVLPGERELSGQAEVVRRLGFDSVTSYVWIHHYDFGRRIEVPYSEVMEGYFRHWDKMIRDYPQPYFPNVTVGWDSSPRTIMSEKWEPVGYPYMGVMSDNTPENFRIALERTRDRLAELGLPTFNINCWNEWTEGSMLEPEEEYGTGYLEALRTVFGAH